jgi:hypothetical protein
MHRRFLMGILLAALGVMTNACDNGGKKGAVNPGEPAEPTALPLKACVREAFKLDYPASWTITEKDEHDPDRLFSIHAPKGGIINLTIVQPKIDDSKALAVVARHHEKEMPGATKTEFKQWGKYRGAGLTLKGKYNKEVKSTVRIFAFTDSQKTFVITEFLPADNKQQLAPGFRAVENSFQVIK